MESNIPALQDEQTDWPGIDIYSESNPRSVINIVPDSLKTAILAVPKKYIGQDEKSLRITLKPSQTHSHIRTSFWYEYNHAQETQKKMRISAIAGGVCSKEYFEDYVMKDPQVMAWILCPPTSYEAALRNALEVGTSRLLEILQLPITNPNGSINSNAANVVLKAFMLVDLRMKGSIVQRHEIKGQMQNVNLNMGNSSTGDMLLENDMKAVEERIQVLQRKHERMLLRQFEPAVSVEGVVMAEARKVGNVQDSE